MVLCIRATVGDIHTKIVGEYRITKTVTARIKAVDGRTRTTGTCMVTWALDLPDIPSMVPAVSLAMHQG